MRREWERLGRPGYWLVIYVTAHDRLQMALDAGVVERVRCDW